MVLSKKKRLYLLEMIDITPLDSTENILEKQKKEEGQ